MSFSATFSKVCCNYLTFFVRSTTKCWRNSGWACFRIPRNVSFIWEKSNYENKFHYKLFNLWLNTILCSTTNRNSKNTVRIAITITVVIIFATVSGSPYINGTKSFSSLKWILKNVKKILIKINLGESQFITYLIPSSIAFSAK